MHYASEIFYRSLSVNQTFILRVQSISSINGINELKFNTQFIKLPLYKRPPVYRISQ